MRIDGNFSEAFDCVTPSPAMNEPTWEGLSGEP
jgi:hypothetical protein